MQTGCVWLQALVGVDERYVKLAAAWPVTTTLFSVLRPVFWTVTGKATGLPAVTANGDEVTTVAVISPPATGVVMASVMPMASARRRPILEAREWTIGPSICSATADAVLPPSIGLSVKSCPDPRNASGWSGERAWTVSRR